MAASGLADAYPHLDRHDLAEPLYDEALAAIGHGGWRGSIGLLNVIRNAVMLGRKEKGSQYLRIWFEDPNARASLPINWLLWNIAGFATLHRNWELALRLSGSADEY